MTSYKKPQIKYHIEAQERITHLELHRPGSGFQSIYCRTYPSSQTLRGMWGEHLLVSSDKRPSFCISNVLQLMPPLFDPCSADVSHITNEGHVGELMQKVYLVVLGSKCFQCRLRNKK